MGNSMIFPVPKASYDLTDFGDLIHIYEKSEHSAHDKDNQNQDNEYTTRKIPLIYLHSSSRRSKYVIIYFHGNGEDLGKVCPMIFHYYEKFQIDIIAPEYIGYGIYKSKKPNETDILDDACAILDHVTSKNGFQYELKNVILIGISLGTAICIHLASKYPDIRGVILINSLKSIRDVGWHHVHLFSLIIPNIFKSIEIIDKVKCPILFIHGSNDNVVPHTNSIALYNKAKSLKKIEIIANMNHNQLYLKTIFEVIEEFLIRYLKMYEIIEITVEEKKNFEEEVWALKRSIQMRRTDNKIFNDIPNNIISGQTLSCFPNHEGSNIHKEFNINHSKTENLEDNEINESSFIQEEIIYSINSMKSLTIIENYLNFLDETVENNIKERSKQQNEQDYEIKLKLKFRHINHQLNLSQKKRINLIKMK